VKKALVVSALPPDLPYARRFQLGKEAGFDGVELETISCAEVAAEVLDASLAAGLPIHSVINALHWTCPLSSADRSIVDRGVACVETSLRNAAFWGADAVLLVPALVDRTTSYGEAWRRSQEVIRERLLPLAADLEITIAIEEVWNKFLLSPLEFARYLDELESPWARAYFDVGNVVFYGYPQDWIVTLGTRIAKIHLKDFTVDDRSGRFAWKNIGEGEIDWPEVWRALRQTSYDGWVTAEVPGGDAAHLQDLAGRVGRFLSGQPPLREQTRKVLAT
jgi:L-ribulose-5-phosphate 3-epimerase